MRRLGLAAAAALLCGPWAAAQTWDGGGGNGSWANGPNWDTNTAPASSAATAITLAGTVQTVTVQDIAAAFQLNSLAMDANSAPNGFTVNPSAGSRLVFAGASPTLTYTGAGSGSTSFLTVNTDIEVGTAGLTLAVNGNSGAGNFYEVVVGGRLLGTGTVTRTNSDPFVPTDLLLRGTGGTFAGTFDNGARGITYLAARDVFGRGVILNTGSGLGGVQLGLTRTTTQPGLPLALFSQQVGTLLGDGQVVLSDPDPAITTGGAALLTGFNDTSSTLGAGGLSAPAVASGPAAHFGKVGTGTFTLAGASTTLVGGVSVRDGAMAVSGPGTLGSTASSPTTPLTLSVYAGAELRTVTGTSTAGRLQNNATVALSGGTVLLDATGLGASGTGYSDPTGVLALGRGQSVVRVDGPAGRGARLSFSSLSAAAATGTVRFEGDSLGVTDFDTAGAENVNFQTAPALVGGTTTYGANTTNLAILPAGLSGLPGAGAPTSFVTYDAATGSVRRLADTNYAGGFTAADSNVSLGVPVALGGATTANSLRLTAGGSVAAGGNALTLTSGALLSSGGGDVTGTGTVSFGAGGAATAFVTATGNLTLAAPAQAANLSKNGDSFLTLDAPLALGNGGTVAVNAGGLAFGNAGSVTAANGALTYQVSRGATLLAAGLTIGNTQLLTGAGTVNAVTFIGSGGTVAPSALGGPRSDGASPGTLTHASSVVWQPGGSYRWLINSVLGGPYSQSSIAGNTLDLSGLSAANRFTVTPDSLALSNADGPVYDFDSTQPYAWTIASFSGGITGGFASDKFTVSVAEFQNTLPQGSTLTVLQAGNDLQLVYNPVPEPAAAVAVAAAALGLGRRLRRRRVRS